MNDYDQETAAVSQALKLLDEGNGFQAAIAGVPAEFQAQVSEYADLLKWIGAERDAIDVPSVSLAKALSAINVAEKKIEEAKKAPVHLPLSGVLTVREKKAAIPAAAIAPDRRVTPDILPKAAAKENPPQEKLAWNTFFNKDSALAKPVTAASWKIWIPTGAVALVLIIIFRIGATGSQPQIVAIANPQDASSQLSAPLSTSSAVARSAIMKVAAPAAAQPGSSGSIDDQVAALSAASDQEAAAANGSDSDLASSNADSLGSASDSYNENTI